MHAFLITGSTKKNRRDAIDLKLIQWNVEQFDTVKNESIGISDIRQLEHRLNLKPYQSPYTVAIIFDAEKLTIPAQHALLKTLEEPPPHSRLILETANGNSLLPTIQSRCEIIDLGASSEYSQDALFQCFKTLKQLTEVSIGERLKIIDEFTKSKEEALSWIDLALAAGREGMLENKISPKLLRGLMTARTQILSNVNPKLSLDNLFLSL